MIDLLVSQQLRDLARHLRADQSLVLCVERGPRGYGFVLSTNTDALVDGVVHYISSVTRGTPNHKLQHRNACSKWRQKS